MKTKSNNCSTRRPCKGIGFALLLILAGKIWLLVNLGYLSSAYLDAFISWPMLLVVIGLISLVRLKFISSLLFLSVGGFFLIPEVGKIPNNLLGTVPPDFVQVYWPSLLIIAGVLFLIKRFFPNKDKQDFHEKMHERWAKRNCKSNGSNQIIDGYLESNSVFNSGEQIVLDPEFKGGEINTVFGETKIDLRKTNLLEGKTKLEINVVFSSVVIFVPESWAVQISVDPVFGAFEDKRSYKGENADTSKILVINGSIVFGSGELRN